MTTTLSEIRNANSPIPAPSPLKKRCNLMRIFLPTDDPTPAEILPILQQRLDDHMRHQSRTAFELSGDYIEWKQTKETLEEFITDLKAPPTPGPTQPAPVSQPSSASQPDNLEPDNLITHTETKPDQNRNESGTPPQPIAIEPSEVEQKRNETGTFPGRSQNGNGTASPNPSNHASDSNYKSTRPHAAPSHQFDQPIGEDDGEPVQDSPKNVDEAARLAINLGILPDPQKTSIEEYTSAFRKYVGRPPARLSLSKLDPSMRSAILESLDEHSYADIVDFLAKPPPFSYYLATCKSSLHRFKTREKARQAKRNQRAIQRHISHILDQTTVADSDFASVTEKLLNARLVESVLDPDHKLAETKTLVDILEKIRAGKLAERKLNLTVQKQ